MKKHKFISILTLAISMLLTTSLGIAAVKHKEIKVEIHVVKGSGITEEQIREWLEKANEIYECSFVFVVDSNHIYEPNTYDANKNDKGKVNIWGVSEKSWRSKDVSGWDGGNEIQLPPGDGTNIKIKPSTLAHELGHFLGLGHEDAKKADGKYDPNNIMCPDNDDHEGTEPLHSCHRNDQGADPNAPGDANAPPDLQEKARESKGGKANDAVISGHGAETYDDAGDVNFGYIDLGWTQTWIEWLQGMYMLHLTAQVNLLSFESYSELGFYIESDNNPSTGQPPEGLDYYVAFQPMDNNIMFDIYDTDWVPLDPNGISYELMYAWEDANVPPIPTGVKLEMPLPLLQRIAGDVISYRAAAQNYVEMDVSPNTGLLSITFPYLVVDDFDSYADHPAIRAVWKDWTYNSTGAEVFVNTDPNLACDGNSMKYYFRGILRTGPTWHGSVAEASTADLGASTDWTASGVEALTLYFYGDPCNSQDTSGVLLGIHQDQMWVALEDGDANAGIVKLPDMKDIKEPQWHDWNIDLADPCFADVNMANIAKVYIGFGGTKVGQTKAGAGNKTAKGDTVWFDDIRLHPPRCMPSATGTDVLHALGDFTEDCDTDYLDLELMAEAWASIDGLALTENRPAVLTGFPDGNSHWTTGHIGSGAIEVNESYNITVTDPRLFGLTSMSITAWVKQNIKSNWAGIVSSRERPCDGIGDATALYISYGYCCSQGLGYDWSCLPDCWHHDAGLDIPDGTWTFIAMSVDPTGCTLYMKPDGSTLQTGLRNAVPHPMQQNFAQSFMIGRSTEDDGYFKGAIDDVRIYDYNLSFTDVNNLAYQITDPNPWPVYWYKFDETSGYTAADDGTPIEVYALNMSPANLVPKDPCDSEDPNLGSYAFDPNNMDIVNFRDYVELAKHWLEGPYLWPPQP